MIRPGISLAACLVLVVALVGCGDKRKSASTDSAALATNVSAPGTPPSASTGWDESEAGPMMLLADSAGMQGSVVLPSMSDSSVLATTSVQVDSVARGAVDLFDRSGFKGSASIADRVQPLAVEGCTAWPLATLQNVRGPWRVAFQTGVARSLPLDSLEGVSPADSLSITIELARLASAISATNDPVYRGLPFSVRRAYRFSDGSSSILVGSVVRKINEEANPREEHILLVAEKPASADKYITAFHTRAAGAEDMADE